MEMIAMLGGLSTEGSSNPMGVDARLVAPHTIKRAGPTAAAATSPDTVKLVSVFAVGTILGFFIGRGTR